jgi:hypothetical protein
MYLSPVADANQTKSSVTNEEKPVHWKLRSSKYSKRRDKDRPPSICSDSETESSSTAHASGNNSLHCFISELTLHYIQI